MTYKVFNNVDEDLKTQFKLPFLVFGEIL